MKTTSIASLIAAGLSLVFAASASAAPASKHVGPSHASASRSGSTTTVPVEHKIMHRVGPIGKGSVCRR